MKRVFFTMRKVESEDLTDEIMDGFLPAMAKTVAFFIALEAQYNERIETIRACAE